jgi:hypothetical protein
MSREPRHVQGLFERVARRLQPRLTVQPLEFRPRRNDLGFDLHTAFRGAERNAVRGDLDAMPCGRKALLGRADAVPADRLGGARRGYLDVDRGLQGEHAPCGEFARRPRLGDFPLVAVERHDEPQVERPLGDAVIPVIPGLEGKIRILAADRETQPLLGDRIGADRRAEIGARQQGELAPLCEILRLQRSRCAPVVPAHLQAVQGLGGQPQRRGERGLRVRGLQSGVGELLVGFDAFGLGRRQFGRGILAGLHAAPQAREAAVLGARQFLEHALAPPRKLAIRQRGAERAAHVPDLLHQGEARGARFEPREFDLLATPPRGAQQPVDRQSVEPRMLVVNRVLGFEQELGIRPLGGRRLAGPRRPPLGACHGQPGIQRQRHRQQLRSIPNRRRPRSGVGSRGRRQGTRQRVAHGLVAETASGEFARARRGCERRRLVMRAGAEHQRAGESDAPGNALRRVRYPATHRGYPT